MLKTKIWYLFMSANRELIVCLQGRELKECGNRVFVNGALEFAHPEVCTTSAI